MSNPARTPSQRVAEHDARLIAAGGRVTRLRLSPDANRRAGLIQLETGETLTALVERAIMALSG